MAPDLNRLTIFGSKEERGETKVESIKGDKQGLMLALIFLPDMPFQTVMNSLMVKYKQHNVFGKHIFYRDISFQLRVLHLF